MNDNTFTVYVGGQPVQFTSSFNTAADAANYLRQSARNNDFVVSLLSRNSWSPNQAAWLHKLATDRRRSGNGETLDSSKLFELFDRAIAAQKRFPEITLDGFPGQLSLRPWRGVINVRVKSTRTWLATLRRDGSVTVHFPVSWGAARQLITEVAADPVKVMAQHGIATGTCCYCARLLSTKESRTVGYGPVCAAKFGLPWGDTTAADEANAEALREAERDRRDEAYSAECESDEAYRHEGR